MAHMDPGSERAASAWEQSGGGVVHNPGRKASECG
jgi:hypothetical protein